MCLAWYSHLSASSVAIWLDDSWVFFTSSIAWKAIFLWIYEKWHSMATWGVASMLWEHCLNVLEVIWYRSRDCIVFSPRHVDWFYDSLKKKMSVAPSSSTHFLYLFYSFIHLPIKNLLYFYYIYNITITWGI